MAIVGDLRPQDPPAFNFFNLPLLAFIGCQCLLDSSRSCLLFVSHSHSRTLKLALILFLFFAHKTNTNTELLQPPSSSRFFFYARSLLICFFYGNHASSSRCSTANENQIPDIVIFLHTFENLATTLLPFIQPQPHQYTYLFSFIHFTLLYLLFSLRFFLNQVESALRFCSGCLTVEPTVFSRREPPSKLISNPHFICSLLFKFSICSV